MKEILLLLLATSLLFLGSCSKDEQIAQTTLQGNGPQLRATVQQDEIVKAGVIENNADYAAIGEKCYWSVGDATSLFFNTQRLDYTVSAVGEQVNEATFGTTGNLTSGTYAIYGYFPTSAWDFASLTATLPAEQSQTDNTSKHLSGYMLMKAQSADVSVNNKDGIDLNYKHLASLFRLAVWNASTKSNLKLTSITIGTSSGNAIFGTKGTLSTKDDALLTVDEATKNKTMKLTLSGTGQDFVEKDSKPLCESYMAVLPTATNAFVATDNLLVDLLFTDGTSTYFTRRTLSATFLATGIKQGRSYYLRLKVEDANLIAVAAIPKGTFLMGSSPTTELNRQINETQHEVTLTKDFYMSKYEITNAQYAAFLNAKGVTESADCNFYNIDYKGAKCTWGENSGQPMLYSDGQSYLGKNWGIKWDTGTNKWIPTTTYENHPVIKVTWYGAIEYVHWIGGSLPTEAQWEYACRAGTTTPFSLGSAGDGTKLAGGMANFDTDRPYDMAKGGDYWDGPSTGKVNKTSVVGNYAPNTWGLYDMHGNVLEWCSDFESVYSTSAVTDPTGSGSSRILRGGSWYHYAQHCRSAHRFSASSSNTGDTFGFRVVFVP